MSGTVPSPPYTVGALEGAGVSGLGAFLTTFAATQSVVTSAIAAGGAFVAFLGYHAYQSS